MDIDARPNIQQILISDWTKAEPSTRPVQITPSNPNNKYKYTVENCLPSSLHHTKSRTSCSSNSSQWEQTITAPYPTTKAYVTKIQQQYSKKKEAEAGEEMDSSTMQSTSIGTEINILTKGTVRNQETVDLQSLEGSSSMSLKDQKKPFVSKIGACGRKIADAMKSVKSTRSQKDTTTATSATTRGSLSSKTSNQQ